MAIVDVFYTHDGIDYQMPLDSREGYGWRNSQGFPCNSIRQLLTTEKGYVDILPGKYDVSRAEGAVSGAIPGVVPTLSAAVYDDQRFVVNCGGMWIQAEQRFQNILLWDGLVSGSASSARILKVQNNSGSDVHNLVITLANRAIITQSGFGAPFYSIYQQAGFNPVPATSLPITFATGLQLLIDGIGHNLLDNVDVVWPSEDGLSTTVFYHFMPDSDYQGIVFRLDLSTTIASTATMNIYSNIWEIGLDGDYWSRNTLSIGTLLDGESINLYLRANPYSTMDAGMTHAFLQFEATEGEFSIPLSGIVGASMPDLLDNPLFLRCGVITSDMNDTLYDFGFTEVS